MKSSYLFNTSLFEGIEKKHLQTFFETFSQQLTLKKGEILCKKYDMGDSMYLIIGGRLKVEIDEASEAQSEHKMDLIIEKGGIIGEMCVFGQKRRSATLRVLDDAELLNIEGPIFRRLIQEKDIGALMISFNIAKLLSQRLVNANQFIQEIQHTVSQGEIKSELEFYREKFFDESLFN